MTKIQIRKVNGVPMGRPVNPYPKQRQIEFEPPIYTINEDWKQFEKSVTEHEAPGCEEGEAEGELVWQYRHLFDKDWQNEPIHEPYFDMNKEHEISVHQGNDTRQIWIVPPPEKVQVKEAAQSGNTNYSIEHGLTVSANGIIAIFYGAELKKDDYGDWGYWFKKPFAENWHAGFKEEALKFHCSWDWLIPACSKCNDIVQSQDRPSRNHCNDLDWLECEISIAMREYDIKKVHIALFNFVSAYNKKPLPSPPTH